MKTIIITTDGSAISNSNTKTGYDSASCYVILKDNKVAHQETNVHKDHTNNYAEMYAIYKGTKYCMENIDLSKYDRILIITDSDLCNKSLTVWMKGWMKRSQNEILIGSTGDKVKNQELIKSTYINILTLMLSTKVYVCHVNSHQPESKIPQMYEKINKTITDLTYDEFLLMYEGNKHCDESARKALYEI